MASRRPEQEQEQPASYSTSNNSSKVRGEIHASSPPPDPDCESTTRPLLLRPSAADEAYSVSAAILPFFFPALGGLLYGYDIGATSGATISLKSSTFSGTTWYNLSSLQTGLVVSGSLYGALIGSVLAFTIADFLGRRKELILASISYLIGALLTAVAPNFPIMVVGRFLYGIGIGLAMHAAPMYIAETAPSQKRGMFISLKEFFIVLGMLLGYIAGNLYVEVVSGWRYMYATSTPLCLIMGVGMCWLPASPRWLRLCAIQGKGKLLEIKENATCCLCQFRGQASPEQVNLILDELSYVDQEKQTGFSEIFQGKCLKAMIIGCGLVFFQQVTGQPSVLYYAVAIFQSAGFSGASDATRVSILLGLLKLIITGAAVLVVDRLGRRPLLIGGVGGIAISLFLVAYYKILNRLPFVVVGALLLYVGSYQEFQWPTLPLLSKLNLNVTRDGCNLGKDGIQETDAKWCTPEDRVYNEFFSAVEALGVQLRHLLIILQQKRGVEFEICMYDLQVTSTIRDAEHEIHVSTEAINYLVVWKQARDVSSNRCACGENKVWIYPRHTRLISMDSRDSFSGIYVKVTVVALEGSWMQQECATHDDDLTLVALEHLGSFCTLVRVLRTALLHEPETIGDSSEGMLQVESPGVTHGWSCYLQTFMGLISQISVTIKEVQMPWDPRGCELNSDGFIIAAWG